LVEKCKQYGRMCICPLKVARFSSCCSLRQWDGSNVVSEGSRCSLRSWKVSQVHYLSVVDQNFWWAWAPPNLFPHHIGFSPYYVSMPLFADSVCFGFNPDRQGSSHQPRGCCPNERARGGYPDHSNAWGRVSWAAGQSWCSCWWPQHLGHLHRCISFFLSLWYFCVICSCAMCLLPCQIVV
jgi:hypothetical protein